MKKIVLVATLCVSVNVAFSEEFDCQSYLKQRKEGHLVCIQTEIINTTGEHLAMHVEGNIVKFKIAEKGEENNRYFYMVRGIQTPGLKYTAKHKEDWAESTSQHDHRQVYTFTCSNYKKDERDHVSHWQCPMDRKEI